MTEEDGNLISLVFLDEEPDLQEENKQESGWSNKLDEYFNGKESIPEIPFKMKGTAFQIRVWKEILKIPLGETKSYREVAQAVGNPRAYRAVGNAARLNPLPLIIPCHRLVGEDGKLTGFIGGIWRKKWLLEREKPIRQKYLF